MLAQMQNVMTVIVWGLGTLLAGFVGGYLASYMKKKGENLATHEDIAMLVDQVRAITTTTKEIEAKISSEIWDRQKRWELKRDAVFEATRKMQPLVDALLKLYSHLQTDKQARSKGKPERPEERVEITRTFNQAASDFDNTTLLASVVCGNELVATMREFSLFIRGTSIKLSIENVETFGSLGAEVAGKLSAVTSAIRKELEVDKPI